MLYIRKIMTKELRIKNLVGFKLLTPDGKIYIQKLIIKLKSSKKIFTGTQVRLSNIEKDWTTLGEITRTDLTWLQGTYFACFQKQFPLPKSELVEGMEYVLIDD